MRFDSVVNIVCHEATLGDVMAGAGSTLPNGRQLDVDDFGGVSLDAMVGELAGGSADDPAALLDRRCESAEGRTSTAAVGELTSPCGLLDQRA